jgi:hypothetical protein
MDLGWMYFKNNKPWNAREAFLAAEGGFARGLAMDPTDTILLGCRASQFQGLAQVAWASGDVRDARHWMQQCLDMMRGMIRRDASVKSYINDYERKLKLAREIGLSTADLD